MKNLLYLTSLLIIAFSFMQCKPGTGSPEKEQVDTTASSRDTVVFQGDTLIADSITIHGDTLTEKDEKYENDSTEKHEAPVHKTPDQAKLDSIKKAKNKKKKG